MKVYLIFISMFMFVTHSKLEPNDGLSGSSLDEYQNGARIIQFEFLKYFNDYQQFQSKAMSSTYINRRKQNL